MTIDELERSILVTGDEEADDGWDTKWRLELVQNLRVLVEQLWAEGISEIYIDGPFATDKLHPGDIDGYFVVQKPAEMIDGKFEEELCKRLNQRDQPKYGLGKTKLENVQPRLKKVNYQCGGAITSRCGRNMDNGAGKFIQ